jgi:FAD-dependent urate hydroxylase
VHDHDPVDTWHRGNVLMIGDAAHAPLPTSGQGACQALEDAWHLSKLFEKGLSDIERLFATFTAQRKGKTAGITLAARQFASSLFNTDEAYCRQRNDNSKATDFLSAVHGMAKGWSSGLPIGGS